jgi:hypothetical protein
VGCGIKAGTHLLARAATLEIGGHPVCSTNGATLIHEISTDQDFLSARYCAVDGNADCTTLGCFAVSTQSTVARNMELRAVNLECICGGYERGGPDGRLHANIGLIDSCDTEVSRPTASIN